MKAFCFTIALAQMMGWSLSCTVAHRYRVKWGYLRANSRDPIYITYTATLTSGEVAFKNAALTMQRDSLLLTQAPAVCAVLEESAAPTNSLAI